MPRVTGYVPRDGGYLLCPYCAEEEGYDLDDTDALGAVFDTSETDTVQTCDRCLDTIETVVIGEGETDVTIENHLSVVIVRSNTERAREWIDEFVYDPLTYAGGLVVEPRYVEELVTGMRSDGLTVG